MRKFLVLTMVVVLAGAFAVWAGDNIKSPTNPGDVSIGNAVEKPQAKGAAPTPQYAPAVTEPAPTDHLSRPYDKEAAFKAQKEADEQSFLLQEAEKARSEQMLGFFQGHSEGDNPIIAANLLYEDFQSTWGPGNIPPAGWTIIDSGMEGVQQWWIDDWHKYYYSAAGWADTVARSMYYTPSTESLYNDWMITPAFDLSAATACSLYWKEYYQNGSATRDSARVLVSIDNGATWTSLLKYIASTTPNPKRSGLNLNAYVGNSQVKVAYHHSVGGKITPYQWNVDSVSVIIDGTPIWVENFQGADWPAPSFPNFGTAPTGWTILDNGLPSHSFAWNNNDWNRRSTMGTGNYAAGVTYTTSNYEYENEWLLSPMFTIPSGVPACSLAMAEYYNHLAGTVQNLGSADSGMILIQTTTDGGLSWGPWANVFTNKASKGSTTVKNYFGYYLNSYIGQTCRLGFNHRNAPNGDGDTWYIDDIQVIINVADDVAAQVVTSPSGDLYASLSYAVYGRVQNGGTAAQTFDVRMVINDGVSDIYDNTVYGVSLNAADTVSVSFPAFIPASGGNHTFTMSVINPGDQIPGNDAVSKVLRAIYVPTGSLDFVTDFEADNGNCVGLDEWEWGTPTVVGPASAHSGLNLWGTDLNDNYDARMHNKLHLPKLLLTGGTTFNMTFWMWHAFESPSWDGANLKVSTDDGLTWTILTASIPYDGTITGSTNPMVGQTVWANNRDWTLVSVDLSPFAGQTVMLRFDMGSDQSIFYAGLYIDDINIALVLDDVGIASIDEPLPGFKYVGSAYDFKATAQNFMSTPATFDVEFYDGITLLGTVTGITLAGSATQQVTCPTQWVPSTTGAHTLMAKTVLATDANAGNDQISTVFSVLGAAVTVPYSTDFEADNGGFVGLSEWEWGTATRGPSAAHSPVNLWGTDLDNEYDASTLNTLYFPPLDFTTAISPLVKFWMWDSLESGYDGANVNISTDNGVTWTIITTSVPYNSTGYSGAPGISGEPVWSGYWTTWTEVTVDLETYAGQTVLMKIDQSADNSVQYAGMYIDDFGLAEPPPLNVAVNSIDEPQFINLPGSYTISATLENLALLPAVMDSVEFKVEDATPSVVYLGRLYSQLINPGEASFSSPTQWAALAGGNYTATVTAYLTGDGDLSNNANSDLRVIEIPRAFPHVENLEALADWWIFYNGSGAGVYWTTSRSHSPTHSLYFSYNPYPREAWLVGPPVTITSAILPKFQFWEDQMYWGDDPDEKHGVMLMVDTFDFDSELDTLVLWDTSHPINGFAGAPMEFDMTPYIGHTVWPIMYYYTVFNGGNWYVDDIGIIETAVANIGVAPASISHAMETDVTNIYVSDYTISNTGTGPLNWSCTNSLQWIVPSFVAGVIPAAGSQAIDLTINSTGIAQGIYSDHIVIASNDPDQPSFDLPVTVTISQVAPRQMLIDIAIDEGTQQAVNLWIDNASPVPVHVELVAMQDVPPPPTWLMVAPTSADIAAIDSFLFQVIVDASDLTPGIYGGSVTIYSSNIIAGVMVVDVDLEVLQSGCVYVAGDINGNGEAQGPDVTYAVQYFRGVGAPPPVDCNPPCVLVPDGPDPDTDPDPAPDPFFAAGDVNGNCDFNGVDVTYLVGYWRGNQPAILYCPTCPPAPPPPVVLGPGLKAKAILNGNVE